MFKALLLAILLALAFGSRFSSRGNRSNGKKITTKAISPIDSLDLANSVTSQSTSTSSSPKTSNIDNTKPPITENNPPKDSVS